MNISVNKKINEFENKKKFWLENVKINKKNCKSNNSKISALNEYHGF